MIEWIGAAPALLAAVAVATLPGLPAAWALRFRGLTLVAASIAASFAVIAIASIAAPLVGLSWSILPVLACSLVLGGLLLLLRPLIKPAGAPSPTTPRSAIWMLAALAIAGGLIAQEIVRAIGSPENISQTYDGLFHLNAVGHIILTGDASPFHMTLGAPGATAAFYPNVWHATVALVSGLVGASVPLATNAVAIAVAAWVWPVAIIFFSRPFLVRHPAHLVLLAILAASFTAFPYLLLAWGVLYANLLSTALIPIALGFIYPAVRYRTVHSRASLLALWIAAAGAVGAAALAHPNSLFGIAAFTFPVLLIALNDARRLEISTRDRVLRWSSVGVVLAVCIAMWSIVRTGDNTRNYGGGLVQAFFSGFANAPMLGTRAWFLSVLVVIGVIVLLVSRRHRWLILSYAIVLGLFMIAKGLDGPVRDVFTGAWYNDAHRLAALLPIAAVPLAGIAAAKLFDYVQLGVRQADTALAPRPFERYLPMIGMLAVFALLFAGARGPAIPAQSGWIKELYNPAMQTGLLSPDEHLLLQRVADEVPADAIIAGDPWTGTGLALAISGRGVLFAELGGSHDEESLALARDFLSLGAEACRLLNDLGVSYLLDFGEQRYDNGQHDKYALYRGLHDIAESPIVSEVDREGEAALFRVNCR